MSAEPALTGLLSKGAPNVNLLSNIKYTDKVVNQMGKDLYHGFPLSVDELGGYGTVKTIIGGDGMIRTQVEIPGAINGTKGVYQYIIEPDGITVNHRLFVPTN